jgi:hypothetical protein
MIMIGDMFNQGLKYRVEALCNDLSGLLGQQSSVYAQSFQAQTQGDGYGLFRSGTSSWWPRELGQPSSSGAQNDMRYAFFPAARRLAIQQGEAIEVYDSGDHQLSGFSQQQGGGQSLTFTSQHGTVRLSELPLVSRISEDGRSAPSRDDAASPPLQAEAHNASSPSPPQAPYSSAPAIPGAALAVADIFKTIKDLAALRQDGVLTEEEFAAKKAELLKRI